MKILILSPIHELINANDYRVCLFGIQIEDFVIGLIMDFNWRRFK